MKLVTAAALVVATLAAAGRAQAQDDREALKKRILDAVEKRLKQEEERILQDIAKLIDEELKRRAKPGAQDPKPEAKPESKPEAKPEGAPARKARPYLGVQLEMLDDATLEERGLKHGMLVTMVVEGSAAAKGGVQADDVILAIDGQDTSSREAMGAILSKKSPGNEIKMSVQRGKDRKDLKVTLGTHPDDQSAPPREEPPKSDKAPAPEPQSEGDLRERIKKFMDKSGEKSDPKAAKPEGDSGFGLDEEMLDRIRPLFEQLGGDVDKYFEKGKDGKWRLRTDLTEGFTDMFKDLELPDWVRRMRPGGEAAPAEKAAKPAPAPKREAAPSKAWLGVMPEDLSDDTRAKLKLGKGVGLMVVETREKSPARAMLKRGDIIVRIDGKPLVGESGLAAFIDGAKPGQEAELTVLRDGKEQSIRVKLGGRED
jgi:PDZ domain-containing protein